MVKREMATTPIDIYCESLDVMCERRETEIQPKLVGWRWETRGEFYLSRLGRARLSILLPTLRFSRGVGIGW